MNIPRYELNEWLDELKPYQRNIVKNLVEKYGIEEAIDKWMIANGPESTVKFGGESNNTNEKFSEKFKCEVNKFICGHPSYDKYRDEYSKISDSSKTIAISSISSLIGSQLGVSATVLVPAVVLTLYLVGIMGKNAYCSGITF
ncbi:MAG: hypothetical protein KIC98_08505 [Clostridioides difficile]|nr:hypothetical protein [Clostridioides difficile]